MVATLHAPAGLVRRPARGETPIFVAARIAERKSRKSAPVFAMGDRLFPTILAVARWRLFGCGALGVVARVEAALPALTPP
jgi:hypothetical protein